jgi:hypothetical protein
MTIDKITYCIDLIALVVQIIATFFMFLNSPINIPSGAFMGNDVDYSTPNKQNKRLKFGFKLLCIGFVLQMFSLIMKNPL